MKQLKKLSEKWIEDFCEWYDAKQSILFEAFINYYGEETRKEITRKIDDVPYYFILSDMSYLSSKNIPDNPLAKKLESYFRFNKVILDTMKRNGARKREILAKAVNTSMLTKYPRGSYEYYLNYYFVLEPSVATTHFESNGTNPIIVLPVYFINDNIIFHELNHVLTTPEDKENLYPNMEVDELLNELTAREIHEIFKNLGGDKIIPYELEIEEDYKNNLFLMQEFYEKFKNLIKISVKKKDITVLEEALGKENLRIYFALVKKLYHQKVISDIDISRIKFLIWHMEMFYKTKKECYQKIRKI